MSDLKSILKKIYGSKAEKILKNIPNYKKAKNKDFWYKNIVLYITYADSFIENGKADFNTLTNKIKYIKNLGCNAIHVLPFLKSPLVDAGFDVSDYINVRHDLGGNNAFEKFLKKCKKNKITVFADLVLNHVSQEHDWFKRAIDGNKYYQNFFIHAKSKPKLLSKYKNNSGVWAKYLLGDNVVKIKIIFPEQAGELPHWIYKNGYFYYHTFYPHQIDVDWNNPDVFIEFSKIVNHWAKKGLSFRIDAVPFIGKNIYRDLLENTKNTYLIVEALNLIVKNVNPKGVFLVESTQPIKIIKKYLKDSELAYNFHLTNAMWATIVSKDKKYLEQTIKSTSNIPKNNQWITFLRNHDQLMPGFLGEKIKKMLIKNLSKNSLSFNKGTELSGRTASFLDDNPKKIIMAHFLLASLPGSPAIYYGDEISKLNDLDYMKKQTMMKRKLLKDETLADDSRDVGRGQISENEIKKGKMIYAVIGKIFPLRSKYEFSINKITMIKNDKEIFSAKSGKVIIYINLGNKTKTISMKKKYAKLHAINNAKFVKDKLILPEYSGIWLK